MAIDFDFFVQNQMSVLRLIAVCLCVAEMGGFYLHFFTLYAPHNTIFRQPERGLPTFSG